MDKAENNDKIGPPALNMAKRPSSNISVSQWNEPKEGRLTAAKVVVVIVYCGMNMRYNMSLYNHVRAC